MHGFPYDMHAYLQIAEVLAGKMCRVIDLARSVCQVVHLRLESV
jgi:hypothetical protein